MRQHASFLKHHISAAALSVAAGVAPVSPAQAQAAGTTGGVLSPTPRAGFEKACERASPAGLGRCPAPFERHMPNGWMFLEQDSGGLAAGIYNLVLHPPTGQCFPMTEQESLGHPLLPEGVEKVRNCYIMPKLPGDYTPPARPAGLESQTQRQNRLDRARAGQAPAPQPQAAVVPAATSPSPRPAPQPAQTEAYRQAEAQLLTAVYGAPGWWNQPNVLPSVADLSGLTGTFSRRQEADGLYHSRCSYSNGITAPVGAGLILDNRLLWSVEADCRLRPLIEAIDGKSSQSRFTTAAPLLEAFGKSSPGLLPEVLGLDLPGVGRVPPGARVIPGTGVVLPMPPVVATAAILTMSGTPRDQPYRVLVKGGSGTVATAACKLPDGRTASPGDGFIPADRSGVYEIKPDCSFNLLVRRAEVRVFKGADGAARGYHALPSVMPTIGNGAIQVPVPPPLPTTPIGMLPPLGSSQRLVPFSQDSIPAAAVVVGAGEAGAGLAAGLEAALGRLGAQAAMNIPQVRMAILGTAGVVIAAEGMKSIYNYMTSPQAIPVTPVIPSIENILNRQRKVALPVTAENATLKAPGKCDEDTHAKFRSQIEAYCKDPADKYVKAGCLQPPFNSVAAIENRIMKLDLCIQARENEANICFAGGDEDHKRETDDKLRDMLACTRRLNALPKVMP